MERGLRSTPLPLFNVAYGLGKAACDRVAAEMAAELKPHGVATLSLWPGMVGTEQIRESAEEGRKAGATDRAMRSLGFNMVGAANVRGTAYCCECNLCSLYSCPEDLDPKNVCVESKPIARERGLVFKGQPQDVQAHPLAEGRRVPTRRLMARLGLNGFRNVGPLVEHDFTPPGSSSRSSSTRGRRPSPPSSPASG